MRRLLLVLLAGVCLPSTAVAAPSSLILHPHFRLVTRDAVWVAATDRYLFVSTAPLGAAAQNVLIDRRTGHRRRLSIPSGCSVASARFEGPWLVFGGCSSPPYVVALYGLSSRRWWVVQANDSIQGQCSVHDTAPMPQCVFVAAGSRWVEYEVIRFCSGCSDSRILQSLRDPQTTVSDPARLGGRRIAALNAPSGVQTLCRPLRVTPGGPFELSDPSAFAFYGRFSIAWGIGHATLERCGSHLRYSLPLAVRVGPAISIGFWRASSDLVAWQTSSGWIGGLFLPTLRRFTTRLPDRAVGQLAAVSRRTVYILGTVAPGQPGELWAATL